MRGEKTFRKNMEKICRCKLEEIQDIRIDNESYMRLCVENLGTVWGYTLISMAHYFEQNGDLVQDPDVVFAISNTTGSITPVSIQHSFGVVRTYFFITEEMKNRSGCKDLMQFMNYWTKNLISQGFHKEPLIRNIAA